jgi:hypothetical protein
MRLFFVVVLCGLLCGGFFGLSAQSEGMLPRWEVMELSKSIVESVDQAKSVLEQVRPKEWQQDGAPSAYVDQYESLGIDLGNLRLSAEALGRQPEKLSVVIDTLLWLDRASSMVGSMAGGVRRYQNAAVADLLDAAVGNGVAAMATLKEYMRQLAVDQEAAMEIAHSEAQRCRERLATQPRD